MPRPTKCQLCDWEHARAPIPVGVAIVCGFRLCQRHVARLQEIAADAGMTYVPEQAL